MWPASDEFHDAVTRSHAVIQKCDVYQGGVLVKENVPVTSGSVTVDHNSKTRRTCNVELATDERVDSVESLYLPNGTELMLYRGIDFGNTQELIPLGVFRIDTLEVSEPGGRITVQGSDRSVIVADDRFLAPEKAQGATVKAEMERLVTSSVAGGVTVVDNGPSDRAMWADAVWERERWDSVLKLADSLHAETFFDQIGRLEIKPIPEETDAPVKRIVASEVVTNKRTSLSRLETYNGMVVIGDQAGEEDIRSIVWDNDPLSPTYWDGPFGHRPKFFNSTFITTAAQARENAEKMLLESMALPRIVTFTMVPDPTLEAGDVVEFEFTNGVIERHMIKRITIGLSADSAMQIETRSLTLLGTGIIGSPPPSVPQSVMATGISGGVRVTWQASTPVRDQTVVSYDVRIDSSEVRNVGNVLTYDWTGLALGASHSFAVRAHQSDGAVSRWSSEHIATIPEWNEATGGTITEVSSYNGTNETWRIHKFTSSSTFTVTQASQNFRVLVVGGGGGSSGPYGGGGGAGGVIANDSQALSVGAHTVTIGAGGVGANGGNTVLGPLTAIGGGRTDAAGGSGGGSNSGTRYQGTAGQGNQGGSGGAQGGECQGGGGGAGGAGMDASGGRSGDGGSGIATDITGTTIRLAGGGGGGMGWNPDTSNGHIVGQGKDGGGSCPSAWNGSPGHATANTGGGGGGSHYKAHSGASGEGRGGSGVVYIAYRIG